MTVKTPKCSSSRHSSFPTSRVTSSPFQPSPPKSRAAPTSPLGLAIQKHWPLLVKAADSLPPPKTFKAKSDCHPPDITPTSTSVHQPRKRRHRSQCGRPKQQQLTLELFRKMLRDELSIAIADLSNSHNHAPPQNQNAIALCETKIESSTTLPNDCRVPTIAPTPDPTHTNPVPNSLSTPRETPPSTIILPSRISVLTPLSVSIPTHAPSADPNLIAPPTLDPTLLPSTPLSHDDNIFQHVFTWVLRLRPIEITALQAEGIATVTAFLNYGLSSLQLLYQNKIIRRGGYTNLKNFFYWYHLNDFDDNALLSTTYKQYCDAGYDLKRQYHARFAMLQEPSHARKTPAPSVSVTSPSPANLDFDDDSTCTSHHLDRSPPGGELPPSTCLLLDNTTCSSGPPSDCQFSDNSDTVPNDHYDLAAYDDAIYFPQSHDHYDHTYHDCLHDYAYYDDAANTNSVDDTYHANIDDDQYSNSTQPF